MLVKKEDKRVIKTKRDLRNSLASLLKKNPYAKITVCDICEEAQINRMTFYKHYMDKADLLNDIFNFDRVFVSDLEKLKIAYEVMRDLESRDDIKGLKNAVTSVKNLIANDIAFDVCFSK